MGADTFQIRKEEKDPTENKLKHEWLNVIFVGTSILTYLLYMTTGNFNDNIVILLQNYPNGTL